MRTKTLLKVAVSVLVQVAFSLSLVVEGQNLPAKYHFSDNGQRLIRGNAPNNSFYNKNNIDTVFLQFAETDYWTKLTNNYAISADLAATLIYKGITYNSVGVRFKGLTSYMMVSGQKKSFNITLDYTNDKQNIEGYTTLNLNNAAEDPSFMREFLYNYFQEKDVPCANTSYKVLIINGISWGLYVNVQQLNKQHAREWFTDADATRWRAIDTAGFSFGGGGGGTPPTGGGTPPVGGGTPPTGAGGGDMGTAFGAGKSSLNYLGSDTSLYKSHYTLKNAYKANPWADLVAACTYLDTLPMANRIDSLSKVFDIDAALWFLAYEILYTDDDSYVNKGGMDYFVYFDVATNRILPVESDGNSTFTAKNATSWSPFYKSDNANYPLMYVLMKEPELRQRYLAHVRTILNGQFNTSKTDSIIDYYASVIDPYVNSDTKKIFTYAEFKTDVASLKTFVSNRKNYYMANSEVNQTGLTISSVIYKAGSDNFSIPDSTQDVKITATVSGTPGIAAVYLYYDKGIAGKFTKQQMVDDGAHNDGAASDGVYGGSIAAHKSGKYMRYYIEAVSSNAKGTRTYSPEGAEHDVYIYRVKVAETEVSSVVINEIMASNNTTASDDEGEFDDWIELYNTADTEVDLSGYYLANGEGNLAKWQFPTGTKIDGNAYLIVWADNDTMQFGLHANFKLSTKGEEVLLVSPSKNIVDNVVYSAQKAALGYARMPNGSGPFVWQNATFNAENKAVENPTSVAATIEMSNITLYPNPARSSITVSNSNTARESISVYSIYGALTYSSAISGTKIIDVSSWKSGIYIVKVNNGLVSKMVVSH